MKLSEKLKKRYDYFERLPFRISSLIKNAEQIEGEVQELKKKVKQHRRFIYMLLRKCPCNLTLKKWPNK